jgi:hypothetical protein
MRRSIARDLRAAAIASSAGLAAFVSLVSLVASAGSAQSAAVAEVDLDAPKPIERPEPGAHRFDEDWRAYCRASANASAALPLVDRPKCLRIGDAGLLSLGADLRLRAEAVHRPEFGVGQAHDQVALFRAMSHADLRVGEVLRFFAQVGSFFEGGRAEARKPTDLDRLDLVQGFVDLDYATGHGGVFTARGGRQELSLGSSRLVGVREGANVRRTFTGARVFWKRDVTRIDALYVRPTTVETKLFDDGVDHGQLLYGLHGTTPIAGPLRADAYYLGAENENASFAEGDAHERRHSLGLRLFGEAASVDWDVEAVGQLGTFGDEDIRAWTVASSFGYTFARAPLHPRLGLKADVASGDRKAGDGTLGTFNALYPRFPYFSEAILVVPANIIDLNLSLHLEPTKSLSLDVGWNPVWRYDTSDAVYTAPLEPIAGTAGRSGRFTAHQTIVGFEWEIGRFVNLQGQYVHAVPSNALREVGGDAVDFGTVSLGFKY